MHRITIDTKHGLSGRFARNTKAYPCCEGELGLRAHWNHSEQWTMKNHIRELRTDPASSRGCLRLRDWPGWLSWLTASVWGRSLQADLLAQSVLSGSNVLSGTTDNTETTGRHFQEIFKLQSSLPNLDSIFKASSLGRGKSKDRSRLQHWPEQWRLLPCVMTTLMH